MLPQCPYISPMQDMYLGLKQWFVLVNRLIIAVVNRKFRVDIGLHHGSDQNHFMDALTEKVRTVLPGTMMFAE